MREWSKREIWEWQTQWKGERKEGKKEKGELDLRVEKREQINEERQHGKSWRAQLISYCPFPWETSNKSVLVSDRKSFWILCRKILMAVVLQHPYTVTRGGGRSFWRSSQRPAWVHKQALCLAHKEYFPSPQIAHPLSLTGTSGGWHLIP